MNSVAALLTEMTRTQDAPDDYFGDDGLIYCGKCRSPKQFRLNDKSIFGNRPLPVNCRCKQAQIDKEKADAEYRRHCNRVEELKRIGFSDDAMCDWTFENDNGLCPQIERARFYVDHFQEMEKQNIGYLLWGAVGTGKSFFAGCIANTLMEQEISVRMTNFAAILNDLSAAYDGRNEYIEHLNRCRLLILDDFGIERGTEYGLEQIYNIVDSRYRSGKPLIVSTNLTLAQLQNPPDTAHARIYDRVLEMCVPICFTGGNLRRAKAVQKFKTLKTMISDNQEKTGNNIQ